MRNAMLMMCAVLVVAAPAMAQDERVAAAQKEQPAAAQKEQAAAKPPEPGPRYTRTLTNVQVELTLTDQIGSAPTEKKTVSMIVASGNWGKIRNTAARTGPFQIGLNVDARPLVSVDGPIQLELTLYYYPPQGKPDAPVLPTELNQSLTVVLQSGKPLLISQAADPSSDRRVTVEVKATVLK